MATSVEIAALDLHRAMKKAQRGENESGPFWNTKELVEALYRFNDFMEGKDGTEPGGHPSVEGPREGRAVRRVEHSG
jgi:hypothetical protein